MHIMERIIQLSPLDFEAAWALALTMGLISLAVALLHLWGLLKEH